MNFRRSEQARFLRALVLTPLLLASGCSSEMSDLQQFIAEEKAKKPGSIEPLPQIQPYETFTYQAQGVRSPFVPDAAETPASEAAGGSTSGIHPDFNRNKEYLEQFPLDSLSMAGTIEVNNQEFALVVDPDGAVHRVQVGNYLGQNHGEIIEISGTQIVVNEIVPDGLGGWMENQAAIALDE